MRARLRSLAILTLTAVLAASNAAAQGVPSPFEEPETSRAPPKQGARKAAPVPGSGLPVPPPVWTDDDVGPTAGTAGTATVAPVQREDLAPAPVNEQTRAIERNDLTPVMAADGSGLPYELWQGLSAERVEKLLATLEIPPQSPVLANLFRRLVTSRVPPPSGREGDTAFMALRADALERAGLFDDAAAVLTEGATAGLDPALRLVAARALMAKGDRARGCEALPLPAEMAAETLPARLKAEAGVIGAMCALISGKPEAARLQADLTRERGGAETAHLDAIDAVAAGAKPVPGKGQKVDVIGLRILEIGGPINAAVLVSSASPALLAALARDPATEPGARLDASERAAKANILPSEDLAAAYRAFKDTAGATLLADGDDGAPGPAGRAALFQAAETETTPLKKARLVRSFLDSAARNGLAWPALQTMAPAATSLPRIAEIGWFCETGIETALAAGDFESARSWADLGNSLAANGATGGARFTHWLALADLADPRLTEGRSRHLAALEQEAARGRFTPDLLHRLATVLDALEIQVPIPLWDLASRAPQPSTGHLPATGVLSELSEASKKKEFGHTVLIAMQAIGPSTAGGAHMIALGDSIRALRRAGLEAEARRLALEALFRDWPRGPGG